MPESRRQLLLAGCAAAVAGVAAIGAVLWLGGAGASGGLATDGDFVLSEPGVYSEPTAVPLADVTGERLPGIALTSVDGSDVTVHDHRASPMVINVWYSTCPPCARELSDFAEVDRELGDRVRFVGIDPRDTLDEMMQFAAARGVAYELLRDDGSWVVEMGVIAYPTTLFVDERGTVVRQAGVLDADELRGHLDDLFGIG